MQEMQNWRNMFPRERFTTSDLMDTSIQATTTGPRAVVVSHLGVGRCVDTVSGITIGRPLNFGGPLYYRFKSKRPVNINYIDIKEADDATIQLCYFGPDNQVSELPMPTDATQEQKMRTELGKLLAGLNVSKEERVYTAGSLEIRREDWHISGKVGATTTSLSFARMATSKGTLYCCHTAECFARICSKLNLYNMPGDDFLTRAINLSKRICIIHPLVELAERKGNVLYLAGKLHKDDVFVRKVPVDDDVEKVKKVINFHQACSNIGNVVSLRSIECDASFVYLAFEGVEGNLVSYMSGLLVEPDAKNRESILLEYLRNVVLALLQVHHNGFIHGCVAPQNVLVRKRPESRMIKLCGFGKCVRIPESEKENTTTPDYLHQNYQLARTILNVLAPETHEYDDNYVREEAPEPGWSSTGKKGQKFIRSLKAVGQGAADLCESLLDPESGMDLLKAFNHYSFLNANTILDFLCEVSGELLKRDVREVEHLANSVFGKDWKNVFNDDIWLNHMEEVSMGERKNPNDKAYNTKSLRSLIRLFRNTRIHPEGFEPAKSAVTFVDFITKRFPKLLRLIHNHVMENWQETELYHRYFKQAYQIM